MQAIEEREVPPGFYIDDQCTEEIELFIACHDDGWCGAERDTLLDAQEDARAEHARRSAKSSEEEPTDWHDICDKYAPIAAAYRSVARLAEIEKTMDELRSEQRKLTDGAAGALAKTGCPSERAHQVIRVSIGLVRFPSRRS